MEQTLTILFSFLVNTESRIEKIDFAVMEALLDILSRPATKGTNLVRSYLAWYELWWEKNPKLRETMDMDSWIQLGLQLSTREHKQRIAKRLAASLADVVADQSTDGPNASTPKMRQHAAKLIRALIAEDEMVIPHDLLDREEQDAQIMAASIGGANRQNGAPREAN